MSEKRFYELASSIDYYQIWDKQEDKGYTIEDAVDKLNEQQATITALKEENEQLKKENNDYEKQFRIINEKLDEYIKTADTYRIPISSLNYGDDLGYFNGVHQYMKKLKKDIEGLDMSEKRFLYRNFLEEEVEKRFTEEYDEIWGIYLSDNLTGDWYNINPVNIVDTCNKLWEQVVKLREENEQLRKKYDNLNSALEKTARDMTEKMIYEMEDFDVFQRITDYVEELDE